MTNQAFFQRARLRIFGNQKRRAIERRHQKLEAEKDRAEFEIFLDDAASEGLDLSNQRDLAIVFAAWAMKKGEELPSNDIDDERDAFMRGDL
jgi:hypothetical protein